MDADVVLNRSKDVMWGAFDLQLRGRLIRHYQILDIDSKMEDTETSVQSGRKKANHQLKVSGLDAEGYLVLQERLRPDEELALTALFSLSSLIIHSILQQIPR